MQVIIIKCWINKLLKTLCFCTNSLEINHWNIHCFTPVDYVHGRGRSLTLKTEYKEEECVFFLAIKLDMTISSCIKRCAKTYVTMLFRIKFVPLWCLCYLSIFIDLIFIDLMFNKHYRKCSWSYEQMPCFPCFPFCTFESKYLLFGLIIVLYMYKVQCSAIITRCNMS